MFMCICIYVYMYIRIYVYIKGVILLSSIHKACMCFLMFFILATSNAILATYNVIAGWELMCAQCTLMVPPFCAGKTKPPVSCLGPIILILEQTSHCFIILIPSVIPLLIL